MVWVKYSVSVLRCDRTLCILTDGITNYVNCSSGDKNCHLTGVFVTESQIL